MGKIFTESELIDMGLNAAQINAVLCTQRAQEADEQLQVRLDKEKEEKEAGEQNTLDDSKVVQLHRHDVEVHTNTPLVPTSIAQIATYKSGSVVELPPFADGQPFVARLTRPSLPKLIKNGSIPNSLLNQATSLFANGANALNVNGKNSTNLKELFSVVDCIVEAALLEPTIEEIHSVGMELTDEQLMAIFAYTQRGVKALEQFRTE